MFMVYPKGKGDDMTGNRRNLQGGGGVGEVRKRREVVKELAVGKKGEGKEKRGEEEVVMKKKKKKYEGTKARGSSSSYTWLEVAVKFGTDACE